MNYRKNILTFFIAFPAWVVINLTINTHEAILKLILVPFALATISTIVIAVYRKPFHKWYRYTFDKRYKFDKPSNRKK